jgi:tetratricopeptide (TPR) repeat protein
LGLWFFVTGATVRAGDASADEARLAFARQLEGAMQKGEAEFFDQHFDQDAMIAKALAGLAFDDGTKQRFAQGFKRGQGNRTFGSMYAKLVRDGGEFSLLRMRQTDQLPCALFRLNSDQGLNYLEVALGQNRTGAVVMVDLYIYVLGEWFSRTARRAALPLLADGGKTMLAKLSGTENEFVQNLPKLQQAQTLFRSGAAKQAWDIFGQLPAGLREEKFILVQQYAAAKQLGEEQQLEVLEQMYRLFPRDPCMNLLMVDGWVMKKKFTAALSTLDRLDQAVGGDPYLDVLRAGILLQSGDTAKAKETAQRAVKQLPAHTDPLWTLVTISLHEKEFAETVRLLTTLAQEHKVQLQDLTTVPEYAEFVKSKEYAAWHKRRPTTN